MISGLLAVRYNRELIIPWYSLTSTAFPDGSASSRVFGAMGIFVEAIEFILDFFNMSKTYFVWLIKIPVSNCFTCNPRKKFISPIILISNLDSMVFEKSLQKLGSVDPKMISSTY